MIHNTKNSSVQRYADFIQRFQGREIDLNKEIESFKARDGRGIGKGVKPWIAAGVAKKLGSKKYLIQNTDEHIQRAEDILQTRRNVYPSEYQDKSIQPKTNEQQAIDLLKSKGYKILKPELQFTEI